MNKKFLFTVLAVPLLLAACSSIPERPKPFTVNINAPKTLAGTIEAQFDRTVSIGGIKKDTITVNYLPTEDIIGLQYRKDFITYNLFWNKANRDAFITALDQYKEDFTQRNFSKNSNKSKRHYGAVNSYLTWQAFRFSTLARGNPDVSFGYYFKERMPYFVVHQRSATYTENTSESNSRESATISIYFTRAQADNLAALLDQEFLRGLAEKAPESDSSSVTEQLDYDIDEY